MAGKQSNKSGGGSGKDNGRGGRADRWTAEELRELFHMRDRLGMTWRNIHAVSSNYSTLTSLFQLTLYIYLIYPELSP